jgi:MotA/TolQ/ExbB proton channel family
MVHSQAAAGSPLRRERRSGTLLAAFVIGLPLAAAILAFIHEGPLRQTVLRRYVSHPVEYVEVVMFCGAFGVLASKLKNVIRERRACRLQVVPPWDGRAVAVGEAGKLLAGLGKLPRRLQDTLMVRRVGSVLDFLISRGSALELDDQLRALADNDALALEGSYALTRFITWAIPILGFLGTVLGITGAISGVTPEVLENSLSTVTDGLALAFDATALALGLTMVTMFFSSVVERAEQGVLDHVDRFAERELAHRFERVGPAAGELVEVVRGHSELLLQTVEKLVERQAAIWSEALAAADQRRLEAEARQQERLSAALELALEETLDSHARRLSALEAQLVEPHRVLVEKMTALAATIGDSGREQLAGLAQVAQSVAAQVSGLAALQESEQQLHRLQQTLNQNLAALAGAGSFEEALHSLTAAIHLLTARAATSLPSSVALPSPASGREGRVRLDSAGDRPGPRSGAAA